MHEVKTKTQIKAIAAMTEDRVIGDNGGFPQDWNYPADLRHFHDTTQGDAVLMGRKAYFSIPDERRPLPNRLNIVATQNPHLQVPDSRHIQTCDDPVRFIQDVIEGKIELNQDTLWIAGGSQIYNLTLPLCDELVLTIVDGEHTGDSLFPEFHEYFEEESERQEKFDNFSVHYYKRKK